MKAQQAEFEKHFQEVFPDNEPMAFAPNGNPYLECSVRSSAPHVALQAAWLAAALAIADGKHKKLYWRIQPEIGFEGDNTVAYARFAVE